MKRLFSAGMMLSAIIISGTASGQKNYSDDVYYNASRAQQDAQQAPESPAADQQDDAAYYNSSGDQTDGNYDNNGNRQVYNDNYYNNDGDNYIDYDDDSYTMRLRRFYYPMTGIGYWGSVYSPFWADPFYTNPYYGWGGWYTPGFSISFGYGPYWSSCWGWNTWFGYGGFGYGYNPYYYGFGGYGLGFWNGYYAGLYDGGYGSRYNPRLNYGPRGARSGGLRSVGNYGPGSRTSPIMSGNRTVTPQRGASQQVNQRIVRSRAQGNNSFQSDNGRATNRAIRLGNTQVYDNNAGAGQQLQRSQGNVQRGNGFSRIFGGNSRAVRESNNNTFRSNNVERSAPQRSYTQPERSYSQPERSSAPSRSFSAPSRSSGGGFGGGSSRSFGGGRR